MIEQLSAYAPEVIASFRALAETGCVEFLSGTWSDSLACLENQEAFKDQIVRHKKLMLDLTGRTSDLFCNTGLLYSDQIGASLSEMGFRGVLVEGARQILGWKSPGAVYGNPVSPAFKLIFRHTGLSDLLAFGFSGQDQKLSALTPEKYLDQIISTGYEVELVNIALEYDRLGFNFADRYGSPGFLDHFLFLASKHPEIRFLLPSEILTHFTPASLVHTPDPVSWNGEECDLSDWTGNDLQREALSKLYDLVPLVKNTQDPEIIRDWNYLQVAEHFVDMSTHERSGPRPFPSGNQDTPYDAFINYMNILNDFRIRLEAISR